MEEYEAMYNTPPGFKFMHFQAGSMDDAKRAAESRCRFGLIELMWIKRVNGHEMAVHPAMYGESTDW